MRRLADHVARVVVYAAVLVSMAACYGDPDPPPRPTEARVATTVGQVADLTPDGYVLTDGTIVDVGTPGTSEPHARRMTLTPVALPSFDEPGGLLLYGVDEAGTFYATTIRPDASGCFGLRGLGIIEADRLHLSSGLVLPFSPDVAVQNDRAYYDPTWLLASDLVCLDANGAVTSIHQLPLGA